MDSTKPYKGWVAGMKWMAGIACVVVGTLHVSQTQAAVTDALIEGAKLCTRHLPRYEREYGIPTQLLSAIASTESGRYHSGLKINLPWPWTINAQGKGYYYDSKAEAVAAARKFRARGIKSFDVGCMQVNMQHHGHAFSSLEQAFEPQTNIAYAASFLRSLYEDERSWKTAAGHYHSKTPSRGKHYVGLVYNSWYQIIDKLRAARMQVPPGTALAMNEMRHSGAPKIIQVSAPKAKPLPEQVGKKVAAHKTPRMNSIKVSSKSGKREKGIIVVRPQIKVVDAPAPVASAKSVQPATLTVAAAKPVEAAARVLHLDGTAKKSGPNFVFSD